jgi:hypothetical protein
MVTQEKVVHLSDLHFEHKLWLNELKFTEDELKIYEHYLEDLVKRHDDREMLAQLEHYQNQFIKEREIIDTLKHDINDREHKLYEFVQKHPNYYENYDLNDHSDLRERMAQFRNIFGGLKSRFHRFVTEWK